MAETAQLHRVGLIVPSSNVTVETEVPRLLARVEGETFSFHASRMRMTEVTPEGLRAMKAGAGALLRADAMAAASP